MNKVKMVKLRDVCEVIAGQSPPSNTYNDDKIGLPFYQGKTDFGERHPVVRKWCSGPVKIAEAGDILISVRAPVGPTNVSTEKCCIGRGLSAIRCSDDVYMEYLLHFLRWFESRLEAQGKGATFKAITQKDLKAIELPLPPLLEQKRIAEILDLADEARRKRRENLSHHDDLIRSLFLQTFGDPVSNPMGWDVRALKDLGKIQTGNTPSSKLEGMFGGDIPFITPGDLKETWVEPTRTLTDKGLSKSRFVDKGATFVCCIGTIGKMGKARTRSGFNQQINSISWGEDIGDDFGLEMMRFFKNKIASDGISTTLPILKKSLFEKIEVPVPSRELQNEFVMRVEEIDAQKAREQALYDQHDDLFNSLLQRAFKGKL